MPAEPKKKHSKARKRTRRASIKLMSASLVICQNCGEKIVSHMVCKYCGFYKGEKKSNKGQVKVVKA